MIEALVVMNSPSVGKIMKYRREHRTPLEVARMKLNEMQVILRLVRLGKGMRPSTADLIMSLQEYQVMSLQETVIMFPEDRRQELESHITTMKGCVDLLAHPYKVTAFLPCMY